jgi:hypothetical protein
MPIVTDSADLAKTCVDLHPGTHLIVRGTFRESLKARAAGFTLRDTILVFGPASVETWFLFRKPLTEPTVGRQVMSTGTGALAIDKCRIRHASAADLEKHRESVERVREKGGVRGNSWKNTSDLSGANEVNLSGRWPANTLFAHDLECVKVGSKIVDAPIINRFVDGMKPFGHGAGHAYASSGGGVEEVTVWECTKKCYVGQLDSVRTSTTGLRSNASRTASVEGTSWGTLNHKSTEYPGDSGGASRFFKVFEHYKDLPNYLMDLISPP